MEGGGDRIGPLLLHPQLTDTLKAVGTKKHLDLNLKLILKVRNSWGKGQIWDLKCGGKSPSLSQVGPTDFGLMVRKHPYAHASNDHLLRLPFRSPLCFLFQLFQLFIILLLILAGF